MTPFAWFGAAVAIVVALAALAVAVSVAAYSIGKLWDRWKRRHEVLEGAATGVGHGGTLSRVVTYAVSDGADICVSEAESNSPATAVGRLGVRLVAEGHAGGHLRSGLEGITRSKAVGR